MKETTELFRHVPFLFRFNCSTVTKFEDNCCVVVVLFSNLNTTLLHVTMTPDTHVGAAYNSSVQMWNSSSFSCSLHIHHLNYMRLWNSSMSRLFVAVSKHRCRPVATPIHHSPRGPQPRSNKDVPGITRLSPPYNEKTVVVMGAISGASVEFLCKSRHQ